MVRRNRQRGGQQFRARLAVGMWCFAVVFAVAWVVSVSAPFYVSRILVDPVTRNWTGDYSMWIEGGRLLLHWGDGGTVAERMSRSAFWEIANARHLGSPTYDAPSWLKRLGVDWEWIRERVADRNPPVVLTSTAFSIPFWPLVLLTAAGCYIVGRPVWRERRRLRRGKCRSCGYDIRATPARCPECGLGVSGA
jgi:hypothetical protein